MPVNIYRVAPQGEENEKIAWLCDGEWRLTPQSEALSEWLQVESAKLKPGQYIANIGFSWRRDACSGGPAFSPATLRRLSEYAGFADEMDEESSDEAVPSNNSLERTRER